MSGVWSACLTRLTKQKMPLCLASRSGQEVVSCREKFFTSDFSKLNMATKRCNGCGALFDSSVIFISGRCPSCYNAWGGPGRGSDPSREDHESQNDDWDN
ncbi:uncharacterized protein METZ01_LOCUS251165 [marine metagenome]|uniref:Uncharacterized protein n=1 Tax=marine metagenome TaxID=408172 RepID=A0A382II23_9ZZZZ